MDEMCDGQSSCQQAVAIKAYLSPDDYYDSMLSLNFSVDDKTVSFDAKVRVRVGITEIAVNGKGMNHENQNDAYTAKYDSAKNGFTFEGRFDRFDMPSGGSRHFRVYADLDNSVIILPETVEAAYAYVSRDGSNYRTELVTARGSMTSF